MPDTPKPSRRDRIFGAISLKAIPGGLIPLGGATLRVFNRQAGKSRTLDRQAGKARNLHRQAGESRNPRPRERDMLTAVTTDPSGRRLLAAWEADQDLHLFDLRTGARKHFPRPNFYGSRATGLAFAPDGRSAYVFNSGGGAGIEVFRLPLDRPSEAELLFGGGLGELLWASSTEVITYRKYPENRIVHRDLASGAETVLSEGKGESFELSKYVAVPGSEPGDVLLFLNHHYGPRHRLLRFRARDRVITDFELPREISNFVGHNVPPFAYSPSREQVQLLTRPGHELALWTLSVASAERPPPSSSRIPMLRAPPPGMSHGLYAFGARPSGKGFYVHWGDDLVLLEADGSARRADLRALVGGNPEWAGSSIAVGAPEELWVGVEVGKSRDFVRVRFSTLEARARRVELEALPSADAKPE